MTEAEWLACDDPKPLLAHLGERAGERKLRCFAFACGRRECYIWDDRPQKADLDALCRRIIDAAERQDDAQESAEEVETLRRQLWRHEGAPIGLSWDITAAVRGDVSWWVLRHQDTARSASEQASQDARKLWSDYEARVFQADLIRELFGNPFRSVSVSPRWLEEHGSTALALAQLIYDERAFDRLPILADALEDAGCDNADLLGHLRGPGPHVRGCWALDLILGKS
jgi:hypothetical protein